MIHAVIMAGGSGTRFWPASRAFWPKQFLDIIGRQTMLGQTAERILPLCGWERTWVVASTIHAQPIRKLLPELPRNNLLIEPLARNTAPAIGLAALELSRRDPEAIMVVLPADHVIRPPGKFRKLIRAACTVARTGALVTLGVTPTRPETGYGYIRAGRAVRQTGRTPVFAVDGFTEKPDRPRAITYLQSGKHYWNSGMFVFGAKAIMQSLALHQPALYVGLMDLPRNGARTRARALKRLFERTPAESIDYAVMEKAANLQMLPCDLFWSDVGSWAALPEVMESDSSDNVVSGDVLTIDSQGCIVQSQKRFVACVGLRDTIVVETADAILICPKSEAQAVKRVVEELKRSGRKELL